MPLLLTNDDVASLLTMEDCLAAMDAAFRELGTGSAVSRPRSDLTVPQPEPGRYYLLKTWDAALPGVGLAAIRVASDMMQETASAGGRRVEALPVGPGGTYLGLVLLFSMATTELVAIIHDARLQAMRAGATYGLAAKHLARPDARAVGLFGSGQQAREQLLAIALVRDLELVRVFSPTRAHRERFAGEMSERLGVAVRAVDEPRAVIRGADIIVAATTSLEPVVRGGWLEPGQHLNSIKAAEVDDQVRERASLIAVQAADRALQWMPAAQADPDRTNARARTRQPIDEGRRVLLADLVAGKRPGRTSPEQITICLSTYGPGTAYAAVGATVVQRARERGIGQEIPAEWFLQAEPS
jgi:alanine dehydrogenase